MAPKKSKTSSKNKDKDQHKPINGRILRRRFRVFPEKHLKSNKGVVYLSHVPHGFYEDEMKQFFSQFGVVTNVNAPKSNKTGRYKGYAFVEFLHPEVAKIVAETMDNYLMCNRILKAKYLPPEEQKPFFFKFTNPIIPPVKRRKMYINQRFDRKLDDKQLKLEKGRLKKNLTAVKKKLEKAGVVYDFTVYEGPKEVQEVEKGDESDLMKIPKKKEVKVLSFMERERIKNLKKLTDKRKQKVKADRSVRKQVK